MEYSFSSEIVIAKRSFSAPLEEGTPNLIVVTSSTDGDHSVGDIFLTLLQIYKKDKEQPLPGFEEVLLCSSSSSLEEVYLYIKFSITQCHTCICSYTAW